MPRLSLAPLAFAVVTTTVAVLVWHDWRRFADSPPAVAASVVPAPDAAARVPTTTARTVIDRLPLFGTIMNSAVVTAMPPSAPTVDNTTLPESTAGYQLFGIVEADVASAARAIVGTPDGEQCEYRVGDTMPDGAKVHAVRERAVIFERDAQLERLQFPVAAQTGTADAVGVSTMPLPGSDAPGIDRQTTVAAPAVSPFEPMAPTDVPSPVVERPPADATDAP